tara:strand:- start:128 stop:322 length:195 start_codon:yes stop_codon:yes gene_type:complete
MLVVEVVQRIYHQLQLVQVEQAVEDVVLFIKVVVINQIQIHLETQILVVEVEVVPFITQSVDQE